MKRITLLFIVLLLFSCKRKVEKIRPETAAITESVYASGIVKSRNQYQAFATVTGIVEKIFVDEGDSVKSGSPLLSIGGEAQRLSRENAALAAQFNDYEANQGKLLEAKSLVELALNKLKTDSAMYQRQRSLWKEKIGTQVELEQRELAFLSSRNSYHSALVKYRDLQRQLEFSSMQAQKNLAISGKMESDFLVKSGIDGIVYSVLKREGEIVSPQTPVAVIGDADKFVLEMQVDEYDIVKMRTGLPVLVSLDSYRGRVFDAVITRINPMMNERSRTFLVEAEFTKAPEKLYPNVSFEASVVLRTKDRALLIPRSCLLRDSLVVKANGDTIAVKTGLMDYRKVEIVSGLSETDELIKPAK